VYPVIEGARDDQPELDFARDEMEEGGEKNAGPATSLRFAQDDKSVKGAKNNGRKTLKGKAGKVEKLFAPKQALRAANDMYEELRAGALSGLRLGLLHGRLGADDKEVVMRRFQRGEIDVLIATTVIEVGVDVPNATVMVIEHAERFGLAQMHQLRGRVGRGAAKSYCILMTGGRVSEQAEARLNAMVATQNGFELAELDLEQRGPGEFFGTRQAGMPEFRVANLLRDRAVLEMAKAEAARFAEKPDAAMTREERAAVWARLKQQWQRRYGLVEA
jgi:ATP-dependent DNA helicase RecG